MFVLVGCGTGFLCSACCVVLVGVMCGVLGWIWFGYLGWCVFVFEYGVVFSWMRVWCLWWLWLWDWFNWGCCIGSWVLIDLVLLI